ncbi:hypothetical protein ACP70R_028591 [Stipagrostis hirtigluma subsp. patula]
MATAPANGDSQNVATRDMGIGKDGVLPWKLLGDLKFFKELTLTTSDPAKKNAIIMGRKTWERIPVKSRPLPGHLNVILTRSGSFDFATAENVVICGSMNSAIELLASTPYCLSIEKVFVIGGGQVLREYLNGPACEAIHLTDIESSIECDTFMPPVDFLVFQPWYSSFPVVESSIRHSFVTYVRVRKSVAETQDSNGKESAQVGTKNDKFETENFSFLPKMIFDRHAEDYYLNLVEDIIRTGAQKNDRTGTGTLSNLIVNAVQLKEKLSLLTTKSVSIHEAMEQQSISISKAGIVTSLQSPCSVIAAANPIGGRYDSSKTFTQNVELTDPIISRFDVLCVVKDIVDPFTDEMLARFVVVSHVRSQPKGANLEDRVATDVDDDPLAAARQADPDVLSQDMLKKYITYAKLNVFPKIHDADLDKISHVYAELRRESSHGQGVPIAVRHIESIIRMSEAHARMHLRSYVSREDVDMAIRVLVDSFIFQLRNSVCKRPFKSNFRKYMTYKKDYNELLLLLLRTLVKDTLHFEEIVSGSTSRLTHVEVKVEDLKNKYEIYDLKPFFSSTHFRDNSFILDEGRGIIRHPLAAE